MQKLPFSELGLSEATLKAVAKLGFEQTSPIQSAAIPVLMSGKDVVGQSATGSGKTAAFAIPGIERIKDTDRKVQVLVLVPTRELAVQVAEEFSRLSAFRPKVHAVPIYGGASYERQFSELRKGPQIVIGTPGRIIDHLGRNTLDLSEVKLAVLDECDRMLDMGFREDMERILSAAPKERQTVFFSATLPPPIKRLIEQFSRSPEHIKIEGTALTVPTVEQIYFDVPPRAKLDALCRLLDIHDARLSLVFANTQRTVDEITDALIARSYSADRLHGGISQTLRTRTMGKFKRSEFEILVATDVAGRGLDVDDLDLVVNFDLPYDPEDYVHRIGRTGRAGRKGVAMTLISGREVYRLQNVERFTKMRIRRGRVPSWDQVEEKRLTEVLDKVRATLEDGKHTTHGIYIDRLMDEGHAATDLAAALLHQLCAAEGIDTQKPASADPFAQRPAAPGSPQPPPAAAKPAPADKKPAPVAAKPAPAANKPLKAQAEPENEPLPPSSGEQEPVAQVYSRPYQEDKPSSQPEEALNAPPLSVSPPPLSVSAAPLSVDAAPFGENVPPLSENVPPLSENVPPLSENVPPLSNLPPNESNLAPKVTDIAPKESILAAKVTEVAPEATASVPGQGLTPEQEAARAVRKAAKKAAKLANVAAAAEVQAKIEARAPKTSDPDSEDGASDEEDAAGDGEESAESGKTSHPKSKFKAPDTDLEAPSPGYKWLTLNAGKTDGLAPRDVVDAITEGGDFEGKDVGLIKIHDGETHVQVKIGVAAAVIEALTGAKLGEKELNVHFARTAVSPIPKKVERERAPRSDYRRDDDRPRRDDDRPREDAGAYRKPAGSYAGKPGGYDKKPGSWGAKPGGFRKDYGARDDRAPAPRKPYGDRDDRAPGFRKPYGEGADRAPGFRSEGGGYPRKPGGFFKKPGGFGGKPGGFRKPGAAPGADTRSWSRDSDSAGSERRSSPQRRDDDRGSSSGPPRKHFGGPKKGPGRW